MIKLTAESKSYGPTNKPYVARILGLDPKFTFRREFMGRTTYVTEPGLYETVDYDKKGRKVTTFAIIIPRPAHCPPLSPESDPNLLCFWTTKDRDAAEIARRVDAGEQVADCIDISQRENAGEVEYVYALRSSVPKVDVEALKAEREKLVTRIAEIDAILGEGQ